MNDKFKVCLIACYSGKMPKYFELFLKSCSMNNDFDFLIICDSYRGKSEYVNVKFINISLSGIAKLASKKFGFEVSLKTPYKLNDFKPAYGDIFSEFLIKYQFWGYIDIDIIFGNLSLFLSQDVLSNFDTISMRAEYMTGFFSVFKNNEFFRKIYTHSKDYIMVYKSCDYYGLDECNFLWDPLCGGESILDFNTGINSIESITHIVKKYELLGLIKPYFDTHAIEEIYELPISWKSGCLVISEYEVALYHLILYKKMPYTTFPNWIKVPNEFYIYRDHFKKVDKQDLFTVIEELYYRCRRECIITKNKFWFNIKYAWSKLLRLNNVNIQKDIFGLYVFEHQSIEILLIENSLYVKHLNSPTIDGSNPLVSLLLLNKVSENYYIANTGFFTLKYINNSDYKNFILLSYVNYNFDCQFMKI